MTFFRWYWSGQKFPQIPPVPQILRIRSKQILVSSVAVEPLVTGIGKMVDWERFSSIDRLLRVTSYVLRFVHNIKPKVMKNIKLRTDYLTSEKFDYSET